MEKQFPVGKLRENKQKQFDRLWNQPKKAGVREPGSLK